MPGGMCRSHRYIDILIGGQGWGRGHTARDTGRAWAVYGYIGQVHEWLVGFPWWALSKTVDRVGSGWDWGWG